MWWIKNYFKNCKDTDDIVNFPNCKNCNVNLEFNGIGSFIK